MRSNDGLQMTDTHRLSPQTTSSSGYHSDLSSTNQSPQSIHEKSVEISKDKKTNKNFSRISSFIRKQYEKAKFKFLSSSKQRPSSPITTFSKSTSTTALTNPPENIPIKTRQSSFIEPVKSIYVPPLNQKSHRLSSYSQSNNSQVNSHSYRRLVARSNYENISTKHRYSQDYYPYRYLNKNYHFNRSIYVPLSDFVSTRNSAFKPIISSLRYPRNDLSEQIPLSDDPCDLEVAQYFHQTPQWSNPNYFDIYKNDLSLISTRKNYSETLC